MLGNIFNIQKFSLHDGPGLRTTIFFKGCPLRCKWCSNPESQISDNEITYDGKKCLHCFNCVNICPKEAISLHNNLINIDKNKCNTCKKCVDICLNKALELKGELKSSDEVLKICLQDKDFYLESGGGVTLSGGECLIQQDFVKELVDKLKQNDINVAIETTGYIKHNNFKQMAPLFDLILFDIKHYDTNKHLLNTGVNNDLIIKNFLWAKQNALNVLPRIPVIPNFNDSLDDGLGLANLLIDCGYHQVQLLPFHQFGERKYELLNRNYSYKNYKALYKEDLFEYQKVFLDKGIDCFF